MTKMRLGLLLLVALLVACREPDSLHESVPATLSSTGATDSALQTAYEHRARGQQVTGEGDVVKVLPDDNDGSRHQRFILRTASDRTVLVAHNIDLADRIDNLNVGDRVEFNGEYEWNEKGGVIHWTHHDPQGRHEAGWLKYQGRTYQ